MKHISFSLTTQQVRDGTKDVTRRLRWRNLKPGMHLRAIVKGMGLKKGEKVEVIRTIRVKSVKRERLSAITSYGADELRREGFSHLTAKEFIAMFCEHNGCRPCSKVTRIEFEYVTSGQS